MPSRWAAAGALGVAAAAGAGLVLLLAGGGSSPTTAEYAASVDAVCADYARRLNEISPPGDLSSPGAIVESLQAALPVLEAQAREIRALPRPESLAADMDELLRLTDRSLAELRAALRAALDRALFPMATALTRFGETRDEAKEISRRLGFHC